MKTDYNGGTAYEENPQGGKVAELSGDEQDILSRMASNIRDDGKCVVECETRIAQDTELISQYKASRREMIEYMAKRFDLTKSQVIGKLLAENKKYK